MAPEMNPIDGENQRKRVVRSFLFLSPQASASLEYVVSVTSSIRTLAASIMAPVTREHLLTAQIEFY